MNGTLPQAGISKSLNFWIAEVEEAAWSSPASRARTVSIPWARPWRLGADDDRLRLRLRGDEHPAARRRLHHARNQGKHDAGDPSQLGVYRCEAKLLSRGRQIITSDATVTGPDGKLYAHGTSTLLVLRPRTVREQG